MLRFIIKNVFQAIQIFKFQYIPCYGLSKRTPYAFTFYQYFNTSHVTVYLILGYFFRSTFPNFNTSHVTVYPLSNKNLLQFPTFQYIPCYGLSNLPFKSLIFFARFQYIPCYGLSNGANITTGYIN